MGIVARVVENGEISDHFPALMASNEAACWLPHAFPSFFLDMLMYAFHDHNRGIFTQFHTERELFNLQQFTCSHTHTKVADLLTKELLFADGTALLAHLIDGIRFITNHFARAVSNFVFTVSLKKTEVLYKPILGSAHIYLIKVVNAPLKSMKKFCYLGCMLS